MKGDYFIHVLPEHQRLFRSMEKVEKTIAQKGLTEHKDENGEWQTENPTLKAIWNGKPLDYYWSERFKGWMNWPMRRMTATEIKQQIIREAKSETSLHKEALANMEKE